MDLTSLQRARSGRKRPLLAVLLALLVGSFWTKGASFVPSLNRRQAAALLTSSLSASLSSPVLAFQSKLQTATKDLVRKDSNVQTGMPGYVFEKPARFKQYSNPMDPTGFVFRYLNDSDTAIATKVEKSPDASKWTPDAFIQDYRNKFTNATGSEFALIKGGGAPTRVDAELGVKYYEVEYTVNTQMGFNFDSLRSLHFLTVFAVGPEALIVLNCQAKDVNWARDGETLRNVVATFNVIP